jgi:hypothetical protein
MVENAPGDAHAIEARELIRVGAVLHRVVQGIPRLIWRDAVRRMRLRAHDGAEARGAAAGAA